MPEATIIIEYLALHHPGPVRLIPDDPRARWRRMLDRFFDNYVMTPHAEDRVRRIRAEAERDPMASPKRRPMLDDAYAWLDGAIAGREWAAGDAFSLADCAAAPALFYADWVHPIARGFANLRAYRAAPARPPLLRPRRRRGPALPRFFPLGAPDRD